LETAPRPTARPASRRLPCRRCGRGHARLSRPRRKKRSTRRDRTDVMIRVTPAALAHRSGCEACAPCGCGGVAAASGSALRDATRDTVAAAAPNTSGGRACLSYLRGSCLLLRPRGAIALSESEARDRLRGNAARGREKVVFRTTGTARRQSRTPGSKVGGDAQRAPPRPGGCAQSRDHVFSVP
jgi:hypothetical protein